MTALGWSRSTAVEEDWEKVMPFDSSRGPAAEGHEMAKIVTVTSAQVNAARLKVKRSVSSGRAVSPSVQAIADATRATSSDSGPKAQQK